MLSFGLIDLHTDLGLMGVRESSVRQKVALAQDKQSPNTDTGFLIFRKRLTRV